MSTRARRIGGVLDQPSNALLAAATAVSTSTAVPRCSWRATAPVAGLNTDCLRASACTTCSPPMKWPTGWVDEKAGVDMAVLLAAMGFGTRV